MLIFQLQIWYKYVKYVDFLDGSGWPGDLVARNVSVRYEINPINFKYIVGLK